MMLEKRNKVKLCKIEEIPFTTTATLHDYEGLAQFKVRGITHTVKFVYHRNDNVMRQRVIFFSDSGLDNAQDRNDLIILIAGNVERIITEFEVEEVLQQQELDREIERLEKEKNKILNKIADLQARKEEELY